MVCKKFRAFISARTLIQKIQRTQRVTRALHKQDGCSQSAQNFVAEFCAIAHGAQRISKANQAVHFFLQRQVTPNPAAHALADQNFFLCLVFPVDGFESRSQATLVDAPRSIAAMDRAVSARRVCSRNRKFRRRPFQPKAASNFASTDATKARQPLEQKELTVSCSRPF